MAIISISDSQVNSADQVLVADSSSKIPAINGSQITILNATNVSSGTIATARLDTGTAANKIVVLDGSGNLPVVDGSQLTGIVSATISASDPTISTNPSGGVGTEWHNTTSGEAYICTDATAGENVWINVGAGSGNVSPWSHPGTAYGFCVGGYHYAGASPPYGYGSIPRINVFSFTTDGNATSHGDLAITTTKSNAASAHGMEGTGASSATHGYVMGAMDYPTTSTIVEKFAFATINSSAEVGNIAEPTMYTRGQGFSDGAKGFIAGGNRYISAAMTVTDMIQTYNFASDTGADTTKNLTNTRDHGVACQTGTNGYVCGGSTATSGATMTRMIETFTFASTNHGVDVGDLTRDKRESCGTSSTTYGYVLGGTDTFPVGSSHAGVDKFQFAASVTSSEPFNLSAGSGNQGQYTNSVGVSSTNYGYACGEYTWPSQGTTSIEKITYASDSAAAHVGSLTLPTNSASGNQY